MNSNLFLGTLFEEIYINSGDMSFLGAALIWSQFQEGNFIKKLYRLAAKKIIFNCPWQAKCNDFVLKLIHVACPGQ
jgi:hypothetical protein